MSRRSYCSRCAQIATKHAPIDEIDHEKAMRFRTAHAGDRIGALVIAILLPGAGHVYTGRRRLGRAILFCAGAAIFLVATGGGPIQPLPALDGEVFTMMRPALVLILLNLHLAGLIHFVALARRSYA
jgi:hypothetical protein